MSLAQKINSLYEPDLKDSENLGGPKESMSITSNVRLILAPPASFSNQPSLKLNIDGEGYK